MFKSNFIYTMFDITHRTSIHPHPPEKHGQNCCTSNPESDVFSIFLCLQKSPAHHLLLSTMGHIQEVPQKMSHMELWSPTCVIPGQRKACNSTSSGNTPSAVQVTAEEEAPGVALLLSVNFPSLLFSAQMSMWQMDIRSLTRRPHTSTMIVWQSSVMMDTFWMEVVRFVVKPITPGILKFHFVKKVKC